MKERTKDQVSVMDEKKRQLAKNNLSLSEQSVVGDGIEDNFNQYGINIQSTTAFADHIIRPKYNHQKTRARLDREGRQNTLQDY